jgi:hypothetical protein
LFERHREIFSESTYGNQNRFHYGYHYPRSLTTFSECLEGRDDFAEFFGNSIVSTLANYYSVAKSDSKTSPDQYINFCKSAGLPYTFSWPSADFLNRDLIATCLRVPEPIFDFFRLRRIALDSINQKRNVTLRTCERVTNGESASASMILVV